MADQLKPGKPDPLKALADFSALLQQTVVPAHRARVERIVRSEAPLWQTCLRGGVEPHQITGVQWLSAMYDLKCSCILGDEMGLGKTGQTVLTILRLRLMGVTGPILIVCPLAVLEHWKGEFAKFAPKAGVIRPPKVIVYHNSHGKKGHSEVHDTLSRAAQSQREALLQEFLEGSTDPNGWPVLVTTYDTLKGNDYNVIRSIPEKRGSSWAYVVVDEAHTMKNDQTRIHTCILELRPYAFLLLTGTVINNNVDLELVNILRYVFPPQMQGFDLTKHIHTFKDRKLHWREDGTPVSPALVHLRDILYTFMLRRTFESPTAPQRMPLRRRCTIYVEQTRLQRAIYGAIAEAAAAVPEQPAVAAAAALPEPAAVVVTKQAWSNPRRVCDMHPFLCSVDYINPDKLSYQPGRLADPGLELMRLKVEIAAASHKVPLLLNILAKLYTQGHRVLIFSQRMAVIAMLALIMRQMRYPYDIITGSTGDRKARMDRFNAPAKAARTRREPPLAVVEGLDDATIRAAMTEAPEFWAQLQPPPARHPNCRESFVMLLSTRAVATGVNLEGADTVVFFDHGDNPQVDNQAEARAYRQTQVNPVLVIRLLTATPAHEQGYIEGAVYDKRRLQHWFEFDSVLELAGCPRPLPQAPSSVAVENLAPHDEDGMLNVLCGRGRWTKDSCMLERRYMWKCQELMPDAKAPYIRDALRSRLAG